MYVVYLSPSLLYTFKTFSNQTQSSFSICFTIVWERATFVHTTTNVQVAITSLFTSYNKCDQQVDNSCKHWKYFKTYLTWIAGSSMISHSLLVFFYFILYLNHFNNLVKEACLFSSSSSLLMFTTGQTALLHELQQNKNLSKKLVKPLWPSLPHVQ